MKWLVPVEILIHVGSSIKLRLYRAGFLKKTKLKVPVISIGNLSFGGSGKTPFTIYLAKILSESVKVHVVCKSYKASLKKPERVDIKIAGAAAKYGDEACLISAALPDVEVWSGPNKSETALRSMQSRPELMVIDDGFSHWQLYRDLDILLIDSTVGLSTYMRESPINLSRADLIVLTKSNFVSDESLNKLKYEISKYHPNANDKIFEAGYRIEPKIEGRDCFVFCAIANPNLLLKDLESNKNNIIVKKIMPDHERFSLAQQNAVLNEYLEIKKAKPDLLLITTAKDNTKITVDALKFHVTVLDFVISLPLNQKDLLIEKIRRLV